MVPSRLIRRRHTLAALVLVSVLSPSGAHSQTPAPASPPLPVIPAGGPVVRLQLRVFDGVDDVSRDTRVRLYPAGQRGEPIKVGLGGDQAWEADVAVGLYDVQALRERPGAVPAIRWVEHLLVQKYPDEFGRHLQVVNLRDGFGALQIRPEDGTSGPAGWSAVATTPGMPDAEIARAKALGSDLLLVAPAGTYDVKVLVPSAPPAWINGLEIPDQRTRLKTWPIR
jgi:hypothetical protein